MRKPLLSNLINPSDFEELCTYFIFRNLTSGTELLDINETKIFALGEDYIDCEVPLNSCSLGHQIFILLFESKPNKKYRSFPAPGSERMAIEIIGQVLTVIQESNNGNKLQLRIQFSQFSAVKWKKILKNYFVRQQKISSFFPSENLKLKG